MYIVNFEAAESRGILCHRQARRTGAARGEYAARMASRRHCLRSLDLGIGARTCMMSRLLAPAERQQGLDASEIGRWPTGAAVPRHLGEPQTSPLCWDKAQDLNASSRRRGHASSRFAY
jgi:hypothetical protein